MSGGRHEIEGFRIPIHRSLCDVILVAGLPRNFAIALWTCIAAIVMGMHQFWFLGIGLCAHFFFVWVTKQDPHFFDIFKKAVKVPKRLDP